MSKDVTIIGAGLVGSLCALYMVKRGYKVNVYDRRQDLRSEIITAGKSINLHIAVSIPYSSITSDISIVPV